MTLILPGIFSLVQHLMTLQKDPIPAGQMSMRPRQGLVSRLLRKEAGSQESGWAVPEPGADSSFPLPGVRLHLLDAAGVHPAPQLVLVGSQASHLSAAPG